MATQIPEGWYDAVAVPFDKHFCSIDCGRSDCDHETTPETSYAHFDETPNTHTPYVEMTFQLVGGEYDGQKRRWTGWLTLKAAERTAKALRATGFHGSFDALANDVHNQDLNEPVRVMVQYEQGTDGNMYERIAFVSGNSGGGLRRSVMGRGARRAFGAKVGALLGQYSGPATASNAPAKPNYHTDDDLPF